MRLNSIKIVNFRNHTILEFEPGRSVTNIYGRNGSGKTSILEAIHYCALTKGFSGNSDREYLKFGEELFTIRSSFSSDQGIAINVSVAYEPKREKRILVNDQELQTFSSHIGTIPCVTFTPRELVIINGAPAERRRFMDTAICQYDRKYLSDLLLYRRILQQRNALLSSDQDYRFINAALGVLTEQLVAVAAEIVLLRQRFIDRFVAMLGDVYRWIPEGAEPSILYHCSLGKYDTVMDKEAIKQVFRKRFETLKLQEIQRRQTLSGPHRDDLYFYLNGREIRKYASQGQQRAFLIAIKMTLQGYLFETSGEMPITLLDDLFSELDDEVSESMVETLATRGQVMITSTTKKCGRDISYFSVDDYKKKRGA